MAGAGREAASPRKPEAGRVVAGAVVSERRRMGRALGESTGLRACCLWEMMPRRRFTWAAWPWDQISGWDDCDAVMTRRKRVRSSARSGGDCVESSTTARSSPDSATPTSMGRSAMSRTSSSRAKAAMSAAPGIAGWSSSWSTDEASDALPRAGPEPVEAPASQPSPGNPPRAFLLREFAGAGASTATALASARTTGLDIGLMCVSGAPLASARHALRMAPIHWGKSSPTIMKSFCPGRVKTAIPCTPRSGTGATEVMEFRSIRPRERIALGRIA